MSTCLHGNVFIDFWYVRILQIYYVTIWINIAEQYVWYGEKASIALWFWSQLKLQITHETKNIVKCLKGTFKILWSLPYK